MKDELMKRIEGEPLVLIPQFLNSDGETVYTVHVASGSRATVRGARMTAPVGQVAAHPGSKHASRFEWSAGLFEDKTQQPLPLGGEPD